MKHLELPHTKAAYLCPVNGLCDIYEWKYGERIPDGLLFHCRTGFQMISNKNAIPPKMIFFSSGSIGKRQYQFWQRIMKFDLIAKENRTFEKTLAEVKKLIDKEIPVVLFGLNMYYLKYHTDYYLKMNIPGHVVLMVGYDDKQVYIHDNAKDRVQYIEYDDLKSAWKDDYLGISKKNAYFGFDFVEAKTDCKIFIKQAFSEIANTYLSSPVSFMGYKGIKRFEKELSTLNNQYDNIALKQIFMHIIEFTGSIIPEVPSELSGFNSGIQNPHHASRDEFAKNLREYWKEFGDESWLLIANLFEKSGKIIAEIVNKSIEMVLNDNYDHCGYLQKHFHELARIEYKAHKAMQDFSNK